MTKKKPSGTHKTLVRNSDLSSPITMVLSGNSGLCLGLSKPGAVLTLEPDEVSGSDGFRHDKGS